MPFRIQYSALRILIVILLLISFSAPAFAQSDPVADILSRINALRVQNGLLPLALSSFLNTSAQNHGDDMANSGNVDHTGSDGSTPLTRIQAAGYGHWRDFSYYGENIYGGQSATVDIAWNFWINSSPHLKNLLNTHYREVGIGVGHGSNGGTYFTLDFGAQPNVIPFFITSNDLNVVHSTNITLILFNEDDAPAGEGAGIIGRATNVRIAEGEDTRNATWQPWAASIDYQLSNTSGSHTITIEYRDDQNRTTKYSRIITLNSASTASLTATPIASLTPTSAPTIEATIAPTDTPAPADTATSRPTETIVLTDTPQASSTATIELTATSTAKPTKTLTPSITPTPPFGSRLTPPAPAPAPADRPLDGSLIGMPDWLLPAIGALQVLVLIVGATVVAKRLMK
jgi:uncharacterized protein YkwD